MVVTVSILIVVHMSEVMVWALTYWIVDAAHVGANPVYFAFTTYTTLGYSVITLVDHWLALGPIAAMTGILMVGWSTAIIFEVLSRALLRVSPVKRSK